MMVRAGIVFTALFATFGAWLVMKPPAVQVDRFANGQIVQPDPDVEVTRAAPVSPILPAPAMATHDERLLAQTVAGILDALGFTTDDSTPGAMHDMSQGALSGIDDVTGNARPLEPSPLVSIIVTAIRERQNDLVIQDHLGALALTGEVDIPQALVTSTGQIDSTTLLAGIVYQAKVRLGQADSEPVTQVATHVVAPGESLAGIAAHLYGDMMEYQRILDANSDIINHPAQITVGMQLVIPPI